MTVLETLYTNEDASPEVIIQKFEAAFQEDPYFAGRIAMWMLDTRGGNKPDMFRVIMKYMESTMPHKIMLYGITPRVPKLGNWTDLMMFEDSEIQHFTLSFIAKALEEGNVECAKSLPLKGPRALALCKFLGMKRKDYITLIGNIITDARIEPNDVYVASDGDMREIILNPRYNFQE